MNFDLVNLHFYFLKMHVRSKKSKCENYVKLGPKISKMMIGFQIWPCNANLIIFDPLFGQKTVENWLNRVFGQFSKVYFFKLKNWNFDIGNWFYFTKFNFKQLSLITFFRERNFDLVNLHFYFLKMHGK